MEYSGVLRRLDNIKLTSQVLVISFAFTLHKALFISKTKKFIQWIKNRSIDLLFKNQNLK